MDHEPTDADFRTHTDTVEVSVARPDLGGAEQVAAGSAGGLSARRAARSAYRLVRSSGLWLSVFAVSLGLFIVRFLVPTPVGQADNHDGPRVMCDLGVWAVTHGSPQWFRYAYFEFGPWASGCAQAGRYPTSQLVPLELARILTGAIGLPGTVNLIALGLLTCVIASSGIASLATGLRLRLWAQLAVAAVAWLIMADAAFFDVYASPFSEPAALIGLLLVAAGVVYLGRGRRETVFGLALAGSGGFLAILAKQQYLILAVPVCLTLVLASAGRTGGRGPRRFWTAQTGAATMVAVLLATMTAAYALWDRTSKYATGLHREQVVDVVFSEIVTAHDDHARADLRALGLPAGWAKYAGTNSFGRFSVRHDPLFPRYEAKLSDGTITHFLFTHPRSIISVGQQAAINAQQLRVTYLGNYPPYTGHPPWARESRVVVLTWLMHRLPRHLGLLWYVPLWTAMAAVAIATLCMRRGRAWRRDGAVLVLCMTGCAIAAFIPVAYFSGISTTRHMAGMNMATALAVPISIALVISMMHQALTRIWQRSQPSAAQYLPSRGLLCLPLRWSAGRRAAQAERDAGRCVHGSQVERPPLRSSELRN